MAKHVFMKHRQSGLAKTGYYGFSWTYLFFGWFVPFVRGEIKVGLIHLIATMLSFGLWQLIFSFIYNRHYMERMLTNGWELADTDINNQRAAAEIGITTRN